MNPYAMTPWEMQERLDEIWAKIDPYLHGWLVWIMLTIYTLGVDFIFATSWWQIVIIAPAQITWFFFVRWLHKREK